MTSGPIHKLVRFYPSTGHIEVLAMTPVLWNARSFAILMQERSPQAVHAIETYEGNVITEQRIIDADVTLENTNLTKRGVWKLHDNPSDFVDYEKVER